MSQTTANTFITAALLLLLSAILYLYGQHVVEREMMAGHGFAITCGLYGEQLDSWTKAAGWIGLVAVSVCIGGGMFWERETRPIMARASILRLNESAPGQMIEGAAPVASAIIANANFEDCRVRAHEEEQSSLEEQDLTPLERVIRGC